ncbi:MAG: amidohydrolase family protein [Myxococcota bacterium]
MHDLVIRNGTIVDGTGGAPFEGDVAVEEGRITAVGPSAGRARREIDASGLMVSPGWVDIHTHYDGQVTWDPYLSPSSWHGVTTVVMGNCGVGFAPVRAGHKSFLIELMEGVEDIPGTALHEGIAWGWESFPEYLDLLEGQPRVLDVAAQVPHCALRAYVMGEDRAHDDVATDEDIEEMARLTREGLAAGAVGFTTSRTILHRSRHGLVPGTHCTPEELLGIGSALGEAGHGVFEMVSDHQGREPDLSWMDRFCRETGRPLTFALAQTATDPTGYRTVLEHAGSLQSEGVRIVPQVPCRPTGMLFGLQSSLHPFITHPSYRNIDHLPLEERVARMRDPDLRTRILSEEPATRDPIARYLIQNFRQIFPLGDPPDYEPPPERSIAAVADREGRRPEEVAYDWILERDGRQLLFAPLANYVDFDFGALREMMLHPSTLLGLSDGGAHCGLICDASMPTYLLTYWVRDRKRGERIPLERAVELQTRRTASVYGLLDRGTLEPGKKADLNVIDLDAIALPAPEMAFDLPAGGRRLVQGASGYRATVVSGVVTFEDGSPTGALPGRLVRGGVAA